MSRKRRKAQIQEVKNGEIQTPEWRSMVSHETKLLIPDRVLLHLESWVASAGNREVSGVGILDREPEKKRFVLKKVWLLAAGSQSYTEIPGATMAKLVSEGVKPSEIKAWWHRHPMGDGKPGSHNWSGTDVNTIRKEPFGIEPDMVGWLISVVRTPRGWVARFDNHKEKYTIHMPVKTSVNGKSMNAVAHMIGQLEEQENKVAMAAAARITKAKGKPSWEEDWYMDATGDAAKPHPSRQNPGFWDRLQEKFPGRFGLEGESLDAGLVEVHWDKKTYKAVESDLQRELPEFVAHQNQVTLAEMYKIGLITREQAQDTHKRIQEGVDSDDYTYVKLVSNWDLEDL